jgi:tRNA 2-selenouridine synthase
MVADLPATDDYRRLFLEDVPLLDVRAPVEFHQGAFPLAENHPLIKDAQRHEIGIRYAEGGPDAAVELGHRLIRGRAKERRVDAWHTFARQHPDGVLYCFRGGMRSRISQRWLYEATGIAFPRVEGGYKALRRFLLAELEHSAREIRPLVIGGRTGVGKTRLLQGLAHALDLERLAWHRGSAFGRHATAQPSQVDFENILSIALLKHRAHGNPPLPVEDESRAIGSRHLPPALFDTFKSAPLVILEAPLADRVEITLDEYVIEALAEHQRLQGTEPGFERWAAQLLDGLERIRKRLGGARYQAVRSLMTRALDHHTRTGAIDLHRPWIETLLLDYYDPMYDYQIERSRERLLLAGQADEIQAFVAARQAETAG